jgi:hypothetical protein
MHSLTVPFADIQEASATRVSAEHRLKQLTAHPQDHGFGLPPTDSRVVAAEKHLAKVTDDLRRLQERSETRLAAWQTASAALAACEDWLRHGVPGNCRIEAAVEIEPKLNKGEGIVDAIERLRRRCRELRADLHRIESAPFPSSHAKQRMREMVAQLAQSGEPSVSRLVELDGPLEFQTRRVQSEVYNAQPGAVAYHEAVHATALVAFLVPEILIKRLDALIDSEADDAAALSHEARQQRQAEVQGDLEAVEYEEAALVFRGQAEGLPIEHRADCAPKCILGVELLVSPRASETHETTLGYSWPR